ncbi:DUF1648 domain-containing protein [Spirosoma utsteinense]|uniref:Membrane protein n=1 Tax=Spirosoma utsteinense TaxID=2585773 RepID=A0ABR6WEE9_9BACT|nr:DUF1648 domain-containing protein [Spirosoma utsteinense]MBC3787998.1 putative membrane protein [Spirosoma utsteinense]MBC3794925.1 putative membrane protein [Spirosoma utsteinense]
MGKLFLIVMWGLTLYIFLKLPDRIPIHFNAIGQADSYGDKATFVMLPLLATALYMGITKTNEYPHIFNYVTQITESNAQAQYTLATRLLRFIKLSVLLVFSVLIVLIYLTAIGVTSGLGTWFLPLFTGFLLIPAVITIIQSLKNKSV